MRRRLKKRFGIRWYRPGQRELIQIVMEGKERFGDIDDRPEANRSAYQVSKQRPLLPDPLKLAPVYFAALICSPHTFNALQSKFRLSPVLHNPETGLASGQYLRAFIRREHRFIR